MANAYETGALYSSTLPEGSRTYYEQLLLQTLRMNSILVPFTVMKEDFAARDTGIINYSEVFDTAPNYNALSESDIWLSGAHLDSRSVQLALEIHGDTIKVSDYNELVNFWNNGDLTGLVKGKLGQNMVDYLDILARNAFLSVNSNYKMFAGGNVNRFALEATDVFDPDYAELVRVHLEERDIPGIASIGADDVQQIVCITTPRVCYDIRNQADGAWLEVNEYAGGARKFSGEVGMWGGVRFIKSNRLKLANHGTVAAQGDLEADTVPGQGAAATVDTVYSVGQTGSTRTVELGSGQGASFAVGDVVTIHSASVAVADGGGGYAPVESDGTQETRRIVSISTDNIAFDKPLLKAHSAGDYVTKGVDVHASLFIGGPSVVYGVGERPHPMVLPPIDDLNMIRRYSWRGFLKFQMFRPEWLEVVESGGSLS
jgi:N4-gp56 family major capsid protein